MDIERLMSSSRLFRFGVFVVFAGLIGLIIVVYTLPPNYVDLLKESGVVVSINKVSHRKTGTKMHLIIQTDRGYINVHANNNATDLVSNSFIKKDDTITVWIVKDNLSRDFYWIWQLGRDSSMLMSYSQIYEIEKQHYNKMFGLFSSLSGIGILIVGIIIVRKKIISNSNGGNLTSGSS